MADPGNYCPDARKQTQWLAVQTAPLLALLVLLAPCIARADPVDCVIEPSLIVKLGSPVTNILADVLIERGDAVKANQVVAHVESAVEQATVDFNLARSESSSEIDAKQALLAQKLAVMTRKRSLQLTSSVSSQDVENSQAEYNVAREEVSLARLNKKMAEIELGRSRSQLNQRTIRSPIDGIVTRRSLGPGEFVNPETPIATIARINPLNVETYLPVKTYGRIKAGQTATVRPNAPVGGEYKAEVIVVDQVFDAASGTFGVRLKLANPGNTIPAGLRCKVDFDQP